MAGDDHSVIRARPPRGSTDHTARRDDPDVRDAHRRDAAHYPGGHTPGVCFPETEADVAAIVRTAERLLPIGAQSSLTGGATPFGDTVLSTARMDRVLEWTTTGVRVEPGLVLARLDSTLAERGRYYPPIPTYDGATVGGTVATNAAGAATFKYGTTRAWVEAATIVLADGDVIDLRRGTNRATADGSFAIVGTNGIARTIHLPKYQTPDLAKISAGYFVRPDMDPLDLFIGSEGTLGIVTAVELRVLAVRPAWLVGLVPVPDEDQALTLVSALRDAARRTWHSGDEAGVDVAAVEYLDRRCLELLREDATPQRLGVQLPRSAQAALLFQTELPPETSSEAAAHALGSFADPDQQSRVARLARLLDVQGALAATIPALPGDDGRRRALFALREAVPEAVNRRLGERQRTVDASISKCASDVIVPFEHLREALVTYREIFDRHGLDYAVWGHASDGNLHPNALPRSRRDMDEAREAQLEIGEATIALGGCPMAEHGTGRNTVKKALLERFYGRAAVAAMRRVKHLLDPTGKLAPGVLFDVDATQT